MSQLYISMALAIVGGISLVAESAPGVHSPLMNTNIALVGADPEATSIHRLNNVVIDTSRLAEQARKGYNKDDDIEEDENDRFITSRKGKLRPKFKLDLEADDWAEELAPVGRVSLRPKRSEEDEYQILEDASKKEKRNKKDDKIKKHKEDKSDRDQSKNKHPLRHGSEDKAAGQLPVSIREIKVDHRHKKHNYKSHPANEERTDLDHSFKEEKKRDRSKLKGRAIAETQPEDTSLVAKLHDPDSNALSQKPIATSGKKGKKERVLMRKKRCGRRNDDDDDGDANRARRTRRNRRRNARRSRKRAEKAAKTSTTTVTRRVIQDGQVISQTDASQAACAQQQVAAQPVILQQPTSATVVQSVAPNQQSVVQNVLPAQPVVQSAQPVVQSVSPVPPAVQQVAAPTTTVAAQGSLQGSVQQGASVEGTMKISA